MLKGQKKSKVKLATHEINSLPKHLQSPRRKLQAKRHLLRKELDIDPRQELFLASWLNPESPTFNKAYESAVNAGYSKSYAQRIRSFDTEWLSNAIQDKLLLSSAVNNLEYFLKETKNEKLKWNATEFVSETLGKQRFSKKTDQDINITVERIERIEYIVPEAPQSRLTHANIKDVESTDTPILNQSESK